MTVVELVDRDADTLRVELVDGELQLAVNDGDRVVLSIAALRGAIEYLSVAGDVND